MSHTLAQLNTAGDFVVVDFHAFVGAWKGLDLSSSVEDLLREITAAGIRSSAVMTTNLDDNDTVLELAMRFPEKLHFFYWLNPLRTDALGFLKRNRHLVKAVKFHGAHVGVRFDDERLEPFLRFCSQESLPVLVHCGRWEQMAGFQIVLRVAHKYRELNVALAHMGGVTRSLRMATIDAVAAQDLRNVFLVTSGPLSEQRGQDHLTAPECCPPDIIRYAVERIGSERVVYGSDFPFVRQLEIIKCILMADLSRRDLLRVLGENARRLLRV